MDYKFLDKVVDQIVSETRINNENRRLYTPYLSSSLQTTSLFFSLLPLPFNLFLSFFTSFSTHCKDVYGLKDEQEIRYVWDKYKQIIKDKFYPKDTINESTIDNRFLDKVVDQIISETEIDYDKERIYTLSFPPFDFLSPLSSFYLAIFSLHPPSSFSDHCKDVYGLKDKQEIKYVWKEYMKIIKSKKKSKDNINESHVGQDKNFLDKVLAQIVSEIEVDYRLYTSLMVPHIFYDHCRDVYSLNDDEVDHVLKGYRKIIKGKIKSKENINESTIDNSFLDKVIDQLVSETIINREEGRLYTPFLPLLLLHSPLFSVSLSGPSGFSLPLPPFSDHCKDIYGIKDEQEIKYVWKEYMKIIKSKIKSKDNINESNDIDNSFLDKVVNQIVSETTIDYDKEEMDVPFSPFSPHLRHYQLNLSHFHITFGIHCRDVYGIKDKEEVDYIWAKYGEIIKDKFYPKENINESNGMNYKFLNKVIDQIVSETRIDYDKVYFPFSTPSFLLPSLLLPSTFFSSLLFSSHCKEVYGLNNEESKYVWEEYKQIIKDKLPY